MKTRFLKAFAAVMMLFSFAGFVRAEGELVIAAAIANAGENVVLGEITGNACSATDVVLSAETKLTLTCAGADIYYTTDGTVPSKPVAPEPAAKEGESTSTLYADPFVLTNAMVADGKIVVKAIAYKQAAPDQGAKATAEQSDILTITLTLKVETPEPEALTLTPVLKDGETVVDWTTVLNGTEGELYSKFYVARDVKKDLTLTLNSSKDNATINYVAADATELTQSYTTPIAVKDLFVNDAGDEVCFITAAVKVGDETDTIQVKLFAKAEEQPGQRPAAPLFDPADGTEVAVNTPIYLMTIDDSWMDFFYAFAEEKDGEGVIYTAYDPDNTPKITAEHLKIWAYARTGSSDADYAYSDTISATYTLKSGTPLVQMVFVPYGFEYDGTVQNEITAGYGMPVMVGVSVTGTEDEYLPAEIYYTLDGTTEPSKESYTEGGAIIKKLEAPESQAELMFDTAVAAAKFKAYVKNGEDIIESDVQTIKVNLLKAAKPTFNPEAGAINKGETIEINTDLGEAAMIFYTMDGTTEPDMLAEDGESFSYEEPVAIPEDSTSLTIKARVYTGDEETGVVYASEVVTATYTVKSASEVEEVDDLAALNAMYANIEEKKDTVDVVVKGEVTVAGIIKSGNRTNALVQDKNCEDAKGHSMLLYNVALPANAKVGDVLKGLAGKLVKFNGLLEMISVSVEAAGTTAPITIDTVTIAELKADKTMTYQNAMVCMEEVEFDCDTTFVSGKNYDLIQGTDTLTFRTNGGADYLGMDIPAGKITLIGYMGYYNKAYQVSPRSKADIITGEPVAEVAAPTFNPASGAVKEGTKVTVSSTTEGAEIWIAVGEGEFEKKSEVTISTAVTLRAFAAKDGAYSDTVTASYTIETANEGNELAGVSVYPNPNDGVFYVTVPVNAMVEVFTMNGQMVASKMVAAGRNAMRLESAGMYFVRVRANGQEAIKKVVVR